MIDTKNKVRLISLTFALLFYSFGFIQSNSSEAKDSTQTFNIISLNKIQDLPMTGSAVAVTWSKNDDLVAAVSNFGSDIFVWETLGQLRQHIKRAPTGPELWGALSFLDHGKSLAFAPPASAPPETAITVWDIASGQVISQMTGPHKSEDVTLNRSRFFEQSDDDNTFVCSTNGNTGYKGFLSNIFIFDSVTRSLRATAAILPAVGGISMFSRSNMIAVSSFSNLYIIESKHGSIVQEIPVFPQRKSITIQAGPVAVSPEDELIFVGVGMKLIGSLPRMSGEREVEEYPNVSYIIKVDEGTKFAAIPMRGEIVRKAMWDPRARYVAFLDNTGRMYFWQKNTKTIFEYNFYGRPLSFAISRDGDKLAVTSNNGISIYALRFKSGE